MSVNKVILLGRLGTDVELKDTKNGNKVATTSLATSEKYKNAKEEWDERVEWHNITFWGKTAELAKKICKKGDAIYVEGRIKTQKYSDKQGHPRTRTDIIAGHFNVFPSGKRDKKAAPSGDPKPDRSGDEPFDW